jgi:hypothetical protein
MRKYLFPTLNLAPKGLQCASFLCCFWVDVVPPEWSRLGCNNHLQSLSHVWASSIGCSLMILSSHRWRVICPSYRGLNLVPTGSTVEGKRGNMGLLSSGWPFHIKTEHRSCCRLPGRWLLIRANCDSSENERKPTMGSVAVRYYSSVFAWTSPRRCTLEAKIVLDCLFSILSNPPYLVTSSVRNLRTRRDFGGKAWREESTRKT